MNRGIKLVENGMSVKKAVKKCNLYYKEFVKYLAIKKKVRLYYFIQLVINEYSFLSIRWQKREIFKNATEKVLLIVKQGGKWKHCAN